MKAIVTALVSAALLAGLAGPSAAGYKKKKYRGEARYYRYAPAVNAERQRYASTFDDSAYYEHDSRRIPFGTAAWWRQKEAESGGSGRH